MEERRATAVIKYKSDDGSWKRATAARAGNGRIKIGYALINGRAEPVAPFRYEIRYYENRKVKYQPVGASSGSADPEQKITATDIEAARLNQERKSSVLAAAQQAGVKVETHSERKTLRKTAAQYIQDAKDRQALEAAEQAENVTDEFCKLVKKAYVDEVTRQDILTFHNALRKRGCGERTVANKHARLKSWLLFAGASREVMPPTPKFEQVLPTTYSSDEIESLLRAARPEQTICILLGYRCGLRDQELQHAEFKDIDWEQKTFRVRGKPQWGFKVKDSEQRDVAIPDDLIEELRKWRDHHPGQSLILPTRSGLPNTKLLLALKGVARRAKLNCGRCEGCRSKRRECENFNLHKLRRSYLTKLLRSGVDLRTVQAQAGHSDLQSTMRYLRPAEGDELRRKINSVKW